jgi:hypothetical protein
MRWSTNALHWTPALLRFRMNLRGRILAGASEECVYEAELYRLTGELLLAHESARLQV